MPLVILHHLLNVFVLLANKRRFKQKKNLQPTCFQIADAEPSVARVQGVDVGLAAQGKTAMWEDSHQFTKREMELTIWIIMGHHCYRLHKTLSNILLSRLNPYTDEIIGDHQGGFCQENL
jgi:hypothetical protein